MYIIFNLQMRLILEKGVDRRRHNFPIVDEVVIIISDEEGEVNFRDLVFVKYFANGSIRRFHQVNLYHSIYLSLAYLLMFPENDIGYC